MKKLYLALACMLAGCANQSLRVRPQGETKPVFLGDKEIPGAKASDIDDELKRSTNLTISTFSGAYIEVTPMTGALYYARENEKVTDRAFKEKISDSEVAAERAKISPKITKWIKSERCFDVFFRSSDPSSFANEKEWHGDVIVGAKEYPLTFSKFDGFDSTTTTVSGYAGSYSASEAHQYNIESIACTAEPVNLESGFKLRIEPRFKKGIDPIVLWWALPGTIPSKLQQ